MRDPRVLFCSYQYPPQLGGQARLSGHVVRELRRELEVTVVTSRRNDPGDPDVLPLIERRLSIVRSALVVRRRLGRDFDLVLAADSDISGRIASVYALLTGIPRLQMAHGLDLQRWRKRGPLARLERALHRRRLVLVANSRYTRRESEGILAPPASFVIHPGVDLPPASPASGADPRPRGGSNAVRIVTVARLVERKGHEHVLRALAELDRPFEWTIVGDGPERARLERVARRLGIDERVRFLGEVNDAERDAQYARSDVFLLTPHVVESPFRSDFEGFGIAYLEANAHGLPVVGARSGGVPDAVEDDVSGILVEPERPDAIREAIRGLVDDPTKRRRLAEGARAHAERFSWRRVGPAYAQLARQTMRANPPAHERGSRRGRRPAGGPQSTQNETQAAGES